MGDEKTMNNVKYTDSTIFRCLENLRETSLDLSLIHTGREECERGHTYTGIREEYIIHFILSGTGTYSAGGTTWHLSQGQMFLIYPGETISYRADKTNPWTYAWIGFNGSRVSSILKHCGFSHNTLVLPSPGERQFMEYIELMLIHKTLTICNDLRREAYLLLLFSSLIDHHSSLSHKGNTREYDYSTSVYVELAIDYIKSMYKTGINVSDIADKIGISRAYLNAAFHKELDMSISKFLMDFRMHRAANLLVSTNKSIKEISYQVGYSDQLAFSKAFKKKFEMSPRNYRNHKEVIDNFTEKQ